MRAVPQLIDRLPRRLADAVRLLAATVKETTRDRVTGLAAEIAFWVLLSLPSLLLAGVAAAGVVGDRIDADLRTRLIDRILELSAEVLTPETVQDGIAPVLDGLLSDGSGSVVSLSFLATIYLASRALRVVVHALAIAYDLEEDQPSWVSRVLGLVLTVVGLVLGVVLIPLFVAGPELGAIIERRFDVELLVATTYRLLYWPLSGVVVCFLVAALYRYAAPWHTPFRRELPGAVLATVWVALVSVGLRTYTSVAFGGDTVYAPLAAPLAFLVWVWLSAIGLLVGAELNAQLERAHPTRTLGRPAPDLAQIGRRAADGVQRARTAGRPRP